MDIVQSLLTSAGELWVIEYKLDTL